MPVSEGGCVWGDRPPEQVQTGPGFVPLSRRGNGGRSGVPEGAQTGVTQIDSTHGPYGGCRAHSVLVPPGLECVVCT